MRTDAYPYVMADDIHTVPLLSWPSMKDDRLGAFVTTRSGGVSQGPYASLNLGFHVGDDPSDVLENRRRVAAAAGRQLRDFVFCNQVHRPTVTVVGDEHRGLGAFGTDDAIAATDALVTVTPGVVLAVMVADCVPLVVHDPAAGVLACIHAGWGGTVRDVTTATVSAMISLGADPVRMTVGVGPAISAADYQVGEDVREMAATAFGSRVDEVLRPDDAGRWRFDLVHANTLQLVAAGVSPHRIDQSGLVTGQATQFFSDRAQRPCGRFAAIAWLKADS